MNQTFHPARASILAHFSIFNFGYIQKHLIHGYRWLAVLILGTVLLSAACYGIVTTTYLLNSSWIAPLVLSKSDPQVAALAGQIFAATQNRDTMKEELDTADQARNLLQEQYAWLTNISLRYQRSLNAEIAADASLNDKLKHLIKEKYRIDDKTAQEVAANRKIEQDIDSELQAGLITANTALSAKAQIISAEATLNTGKIGTANLDNQISQLTRGVHSLDGGDTSPTAMQSFAQISTLKQEQAETKLKLVQLDADVAAKSSQIIQLDALLNNLKGSPYYLAAYGEQNLHHFAFVPYDNEDAIHVGAPVYACKFQIVWCSKAGTIKSITNEETRVQHPLFSTQLRGVLAELDMQNKEAVKNLTLFVGHSPFYIF
jgi:hypothetical protein